MNWPALPLDVVLSLEPLMQARKVSQTARGSGGFVRALEAAGSVAHLPEVWRQRREGFLARHWAQAQAQGEPWWVNGEPTRRHLALVAWAFSPTPDRLLRWLDDQDRQSNGVLDWLTNGGERTDSPSNRKTRLPRDAEKRYTSAHWGMEPTHWFHWPDAPENLELTQMGRLVEITYALVDDETGEEHGEATIGGFRPRGAREIDHLAFATDTSERLYCALTPATKQIMRKLWIRRHPMYSLDVLAREVGGRQARFAHTWEPRVQPIGPCLRVVYKTHKKGHGPSEYEHEMGEWGGTPPLICVSRDGGLWFAGGSYTVPDEGITR